MLHSFNKFHFFASACQSGFFSLQKPQLSNSVIGRLTLDAHLINLCPFTLSKRKVNWFLSISMFFPNQNWPLKKAPTAIIDTVKKKKCLYVDIYLSQSDHISLNSNYIIKHFFPNKRISYVRKEMRKWTFWRKGGVFNLLHLHLTLYHTGGCLVCLWVCPRVCISPLALIHTILSAITSKLSSAGFEGRRPGLLYVYPAISSHPHETPLKHLALQHGSSDCPHSTMGTTSEALVLHSVFSHLTPFIVLGG